MKKLAKLVVLSGLLFLGACSQRQEPELVDHFDERVFFKDEGPNELVAFVEGGLIVQPESVNQTLIIDDVQVYKVGNNSYEVQEGQTNEVVFSFTFDEDTGTLTTEDDVTYTEETD